MIETEKLAANVLAKIIDDLYNGAKTKLDSAFAAFFNEGRVGFSKLLVESYDRRSKIKTLLDRVDPVNLRDYYVAPVVRIRGKILSESKFLDEIVSRKKIVVFGTAGIGKSVFLKHLFLTYIESTFSSVPVFVELRSLNERADTKDSLEKLVVDQVKQHLPNFSAARLRHALRTGKMALFLDGLDEVAPKFRQNVIAQIQQTANNYAAAEILVSSRPDEIFQTWEAFSVFELLGMDQTKCRSLIEKLRCDPEAKVLFIEKVISERFREYEEFLSIPLLAVMMLIVHAQSGDFPNRITQFYRKAYEALYSGHDFLKGGFKRESFSGLDSDKFAAILQAFCAASYVEKKYAFDRVTLDRFVGASIVSEMCDCGVDLVVADCLQSVCILQQDGLEFAFVHRTFQEYFAAEYFARISLDEPSRRDVIYSVFARHETDKVAALIREIDEDRYEREWLLPCIQIVKESWVTPRMSSKAEIAARFREILPSYSIRQLDSGWTTYSIAVCPLAHLVALVLSDKRPAGRMQLGFLFDLARTIETSQGALDQAVSSTNAKAYKSRGPGDEEVETVSIDLSAYGPVPSWLPYPVLRAAIADTRKSILAIERDVISRVAERGRARRGLFEMVGKKTVADD